MVQGKSGNTKQELDKTTWKAVLIRTIGLDTAKTQWNKNPNLPAAPAEQAALRERKILTL